MKLLRKSLLVFVLLPVFAAAQQGSSYVFSDKERLSATLDYLSADWMEGREAGQKGGFMAAGFVATMMRWANLQPMGDFTNTGHRSYFQSFDIVRYKTVDASLAVTRNSEGTLSSAHFRPGIDFEVVSAPCISTVQAGCIFAGYGISAPDLGYDDYQGIDARQKIVIVFDGFPGYGDTLSAGWKKFSKAAENISGVDNKVRTAMHKGAMAVILIVPEIKKVAEPEPARADSIFNYEDDHKLPDAVYEDWNYYLAGDTMVPGIPCFSITSEIAEKLLIGTGFQVKALQLQAASNPVPSLLPVADLELRIIADCESEIIKVSNVLGFIPGKDTNRCIIAGAHYDHLGKRGNLIYNGADDNASGVSGLLLLAQQWSSSAEKPPVNMVFASWTAEEKGLLGSSYFVKHPAKGIGDIRLYLNMDMISRSDPEDTAQNRLSIGTRTADEYLRQIARVNNTTLTRPLTLDLWDVSGHTGSDYAPFLTVDVPVMTFFSGFHSDYHSPRDVSARADLEKTTLILQLVNKCVEVVLKQFE